GAQTNDVLRLILKQEMRPVAVGLAIGIVSAFALGRLIASQLYEVSAHNPALLAGATILLATIALLACLLPARRATHVDPIQALRAGEYGRSQLRAAQLRKAAMITITRNRQLSSLIRVFAGRH